ncbi:Butirosin biosynthesis, BtrG-like [Syntrophomonas zehnderi OL-4]|uniref:Butirosin biosynthesis, BtrG-like n=2 Tax=Syntrophomonas TaxID=862 RepID=A0A0E4GBG9_9FIRM|nr:Butirosin biosynthesis, BtrG-like [Syntrophomonas zehnderi OL-4]
MMKGKTLYIAYGSNLSLRQMAYRCPTARVAGTSEIRDYELLFRGGRQNAFATVEPLKNTCVPVLLWTLKEKDLQALDHYEGYPCLYRKEILDVELKGKTVPAMVYVMNDGRPLGAPSDYYLQTILEGYQSAGFDTEVLEQAVEKSTRLAGEQHPEQESLFDLKWW